MKYIKIENLIPGKWYYTKLNDYYFLYTHADMENDLRVFSSFRIKERELRKGNDYFSNSIMLETIEEVVDFSLIGKLCPQYFPTYKIY